MGMDFRGLVRNRVWKITFFGLKSGQDLKNRAAHPRQEFPGVPPGTDLHRFPFKLVERNCLRIKDFSQPFLLREN